jgi:hypothetical protein
LVGAVKDLTSLRITPNQVDKEVREDGEDDEDDESSHRIILPLVS